ncbi:Trp biosynthesis-associated membrane protein [Pseudokineococcus basanitobsidens]|uniref:Trp biosynthesis-associated membrane protein n=1 Tax=Pseudokineococcus basanitobsidens TaxID=1926649 RepID=A0ABU8RI43_9ACTN
MSARTGGARTGGARTGGTPSVGGGRSHGDLPRLSRARTVLGLLLLGVLVLVASAPVWTRAEVTGAVTGAGQVAASGGAASPLVPALGLVALAGAGAASTTRRVGTLVATAVVALAGAGVATASAGVLVDPAGATTAEVGDALGVTAASVTAADATASFTAWPVVALLLGVGLVALATVGAVVSRRWPSGRRYEPPAVVRDGGAVDEGSAVDEDGAGGPPEAAGSRDPSAERLRLRGEAFDAWDSISRGEDPTGGPRA